MKGKHLLRAGGEVLRTQFFQPFFNNSRGTFNFLGRWSGQPAADFLLGLPETTSRQVGTTPNYLFITNESVFAQDDWKVSPRLTINLGLRYELLQPPHEKYGRITNFIPQLGRLILSDDRTLVNSNITFADPQTIGVARDFGIPDSLMYTRYNDLAPRLGFAWRPFAGNHTSVRGGYGIFYGGNVWNPVRNDLANVFPFAISQTFTRRANDPAYLTLATPFPFSGSLTGNVNNVAGYELHAPTPYVQSWNVTWERSLGAGVTLEIAYVGSKGSHLARRYDLNQPLRAAEMQAADGTFPRPYPKFTTVNYYSFGSNSIYNAGTLLFRRRFTRGFFWIVNYTYSKSIDDASQVTGNSDGGYPGAQNSRNLKLERGRSDWDIGHAATMNFSWETPWKNHVLVRGWQIVGTGRSYTGAPFTPRVSNINSILGEPNRPDRIAKGNVPDPAPGRWFDTSAFPVVPLSAVRFGNSGRNILDGPGLVEFNLSLHKNFRIENSLLQFRWEAFNAFNRPNFNLPVVNVDAVNGATIQAAGSGRLMQFGLRLSF